MEPSGTNTDNAPAGTPEVVVVTGGTAGVGRAVARAFARRGARVAVLARGRTGLDATANDITNLGGTPLTIQADVADAAAMERAAQEVEETFGPIDVWVNNAMATVYGEIPDVTPEEFRRVTEVTYLGQVYGAQAALARMLPRDRGAIVFVGSALAYRGIPLQAAYCGAKHGVQGFFDSLRSELLHRESGVHVTMVQLPALNTPQFAWARTKLPREPKPASAPYQPEIAADAVVYAATDGRERREVYVGYPTIQAIVGDKLAPGLADLYLARTAYEGQQGEAAVAPDRQDNLFDPVEGDFGAHGDFDAEARTGSPQLWATKHRPWLAAAGAAAVAGLVWAAKR